MQKWQFWIDRGGTFTDVVALSPQGKVLTRKFLSENPAQYADAAIYGIRSILGVSQQAPVPADLVSSIRMGTTVATNALLERKGAATLLAVTQGFADGLEIGYQNRPDIFALHIERPSTLYQHVIEIDERIDAHGTVLKPLDQQQTLQALQAAYAQGLRSIAIVLMHGYRYVAHEQMVADLAKQVGFQQISVSHQVSPLMKWVSRGDTTVMDAYLSPILRQYVEQVSAQLESGIELMFMQSHGGLSHAEAFQGKDAILSGPAGGVVGMVKTAEPLALDRLIGFDMGGTSTDVSHYHGDYERSFNTEVAGVRVRVPMMKIHTVAAGGGSILQFDGERCQVGPDSAGAEPGPACYRKGGPLTVTDCNVMLGKLSPDCFPAVFGPDHQQPLDAETVRQQFAELAQHMSAATQQNLTAEQVAQGFLHIAVDNMASAIKKISIQRGYDVTQYTLCCFGGAGGQHACLVADALGMQQILVHPHASVLSAYGIGLSELREIREQTLECALTAQALPQLSALLDELQQQGQQALAAQGADISQLVVKPRLQLKYQGSDSTLLLDYQSMSQLQQAFEQQHQRQYGFVLPEKAIWIESVQVELIEPAQNAANPHLLADAALTQVTSDTPAHHMYGQQGWQSVPVWQREQLQVEQHYAGPALIVEPNSTLVVEAGWQAQCLATGEIVLRRVEALQSQLVQSSTAQCDPIQLEIFNNLFMSVAEQMGLVLEKTAMSVNIKERLDFSCALFNATGQLIANAPHIPVHLGSMSDSIKAVIRHNPQMQPGDAFMLNTPYNGGTHLPDITVVKPVFHQQQLAFFVAARGHHADVGGITPGSMPPSSQHIAQEGILLDNVQILQQGQFLADTVRDLLSSGEYPARNIEQNLADLQAQLAACEAGHQALMGVVEQYGLQTVHRYMDYVMDNAERSVQRLLSRLQSGDFCYQMDDGHQIQVSVAIDAAAQRARIDFSGSSATLPNNFNAPRAVTTAAVLYVFRCLIDETIPLNDGFLRPLEIIVPDNSMLNPAYPAAVVAGNVETSQYIVDCLFGALQQLAASQGTNNNFTFGDETYQYYETLCGGAGAGNGFAGTSAVHTHMTNSRLTDPEVLEWRFPVILAQFSIRRGSGGAGCYQGGDGVVRKIVFQRPMTAAIISSHRLLPPFGLQGGASGACGCNYVLKTDGSKIPLQGCDQVEMSIGDQFVIETPGGGGWGRCD